ncbi:MAG TPA: adenosine deaminase [Gemmatimonadaceae bacterium]|nr:adenosine deaminase [Gemmatimonadaceae bacterium]
MLSKRGVVQKSRNDRLTPAIDRDLLRRLPKAELHCHLDGSVRPSTLLQLARDNDLALPRAEADALRAFMRVADGSTLEAYLERFDVTLAVMQTADALDRIAYELGEDAAEDGVRYLEVRFAPILNARGGLDLGGALEATLRGLKRAESQHGVIGRVIVCALRTMQPDVSHELASLAVAYRSRGVVGFDLAGGERGHPAALHADAFRYAREHDLACTCHAGEGDGAASVRQAVHICCANRIGHATRLVEDESLMGYVNDRRIPLEICLTSNVQTRATERYETHPLREYYDRGLHVVLNTDNRLMSDTTLTDEYEAAATHLDFTLPELCELARNGFAAAFLPWEERRALLADVEREITAIEAGCRE